MPPFPRFGAEAPVCPMCDGPCTHDFERSEFVFPDRLPRAADDPSRADDKPPRPKPPNKRGKRAHRLSEDRMNRPSEDRSA